MMSDAIITAAIAGAVSLVVAALGLLTANLHIRNNLRRFQAEIEHAFSSKLYDQRVKHYPKGFQIAGFITRRKKPHQLDSPEKLRDICSQLITWAESEAGLYMSSNTVQAYYELRQALLKNPGDGDNFTDRQVEKLWEARVEFRRQLRRDLGSMHRSDRRFGSLTD